MRQNTFEGMVVTQAGVTIIWLLWWGQGEKGQSLSGLDGVSVFPLGPGASVCSVSLLHKESSEQNLEHLEQK